ncbi:glycosyltransferase [Streptomyces sp. NPDC056660]|uniref:glycosyltransferase n=1 Tax=Streptomyces sp. NPDC056660 TaxID=3345897 RepID=UPI0036C1CDA1
MKTPSTYCWASANVTFPGPIFDAMATEGFRFIGPLPAASDADFERPDWWAELSSDRRARTPCAGGRGRGRDHGRRHRAARRSRHGAGGDGRSGSRRRPPRRVRALRAAAVARRRPGHQRRYGGVQTALRHGVPLVVGGETEDEPEVAARGEWSGTGVNLRTARPEVSAVRAAVDEVLGDPRYRKRASEIQGQYAQFHPFDSVAEIVEQA